MYITWIVKKIIKTKSSVSCDRSFAYYLRTIGIPNISMKFHML